MIEINIKLSDPTEPTLRKHAGLLLAIADAVGRQGETVFAPISVAAPIGETVSADFAPTPTREPQTCISCGTKSEGVYEGDACLCCGLTVNEINESSAVAGAGAEAIRATEEFAESFAAVFKPEKVPPSPVSSAQVSQPVPDAGFNVPPAPPAQPSPAAREEAPVLMAALAPAAVQLDKAGLPWDRRIHADAENKLAATGLWKRRRGVTDSLVAEVEAELRGVMAVPTPPPAPNTAPLADGGVADTVTGEYTPPSLADFMRAVTPLLTAKTLAQVDILAALQGLGLANVLQLNQRPDLIPALCAALGVQL